MNPNPDSDPDLEKLKLPPYSAEPQVSNPYPSAPPLQAYPYPPPPQYPPQQQYQPHQQQPLYPPPPPQQQQQQQPYPQPYQQQQQPLYLPQYGGPYAPPQYNPNAPQTVVQVGQPAPVIYLGNRTYLNFTGAIVFSCLVYWCCGYLFGLVAFILALIGQSSTTSGDDRQARSLLYASYVISTIGLIVGIIALIIIIVVYTNHYNSRIGKNCYYNYYGSGGYNCY